MALNQDITFKNTDSANRAEHPGTWLRLPCCDHAVHPVQIKTQDDGVMVITAPREPHEAWVRTPEDKAPVTLGWTDAGGTLVLSCRVLDNSSESGWSLEILGTGDFLQRRRHIRVTTNAVGQLMSAELDKTVTAKIMDISESGMKCSFTDFVPDYRSNPFRFALRLDGAVLVALSDMKWSGRVGPTEYHAGFEFVNMHDALRARIRAHIMRQLDTREGEIVP